MVAVGDGVGDCRFFENVAKYLDRVCHPAQTEGHFLSSVDIERLQLTMGLFERHESWESVATSVARVVSAAELPLVFVDVDRTLIFPRGIADSHYFDVRNSGISNFVEAFGRCGFSDRNRAEIANLVNFATDTFENYCLNEQQKITFKNEEVVAALVLMLATGLLKKDECFATARLGSLCIVALARAEVGGWISGLRMDGEGNSAFDGEAIWDRDGLVEQVKAVSSALNLRSSVLLDAFRRVEGDLLRNELETNANFPWNDYLLNAVFGNKRVIAVFITDRPAVTLGASMNGDGEGVNGVFARKLIGRFPI